MSQDEYIQELEKYWDKDGLCGHLREGQFDAAVAEELLQFLRSMKFEDDVPLKKRLVELIWYLPLFLTWQVERVENDEALYPLYSNLCAGVIGILEDKIGAP